MQNFEELIRITECKVLGELPDPFLMPDGSRADSAQKWALQRKNLYRTAVEMQYGTLPPAPEVLEAEKTFVSSSGMIIHVRAGTREKQVQFRVQLFLPEKRMEPLPVAVDGDLCFQYAFDRNWHKSLTDAGIALALFDRTELAHDICGEGRGKGPLYEVYPQYGFGALGAWAWGYSRCVDALLKLGIIGNENCIAFTGHSRGGKTAMLAGVADERASIVNPNETNAGSCSCYRIHTKAITEDGDERRSETLKDILTNFPFWFGEGMLPYADREQDLPFDCHFLKALVAPRTLLIGEAASDIWTNPVGSWQTTVAAREVYRFLGAEDQLIWYWRRGYHAHHVEDVQRLAEVVRHKLTGEELRFSYFRTPFWQPEKIFAWKAPDDDARR